MTQKDIENINKSIRAHGVQLSLIDPEEGVKTPEIVVTDGELSTKNIEIKEFHTLPAGLFLREGVVEAIKAELVLDLISGLPMPSGVNLIGIEVKKNEQNKDTHGESEPVSNKGGQEGPRESGKDAGPKSNSRGKKAIVSSSPSSTKPKAKRKGKN